MRFISMVALYLVAAAGSSVVALADSPVSLNGSSIRCSTPLDSSVFEYFRANGHDMVIQTWNGREEGVAFYKYADGIVSMDLYPGTAEFKIDLNSFTNGRRERTVQRCSQTDVGSPACMDVTEVCELR